MKMRVLVTGGSRGVGSYIVEKFLKGGFEVNVISKNPPSEDAIWHKIDLVDTVSLKDFLHGEKNYDAVVLNAGIVGVQGKDSKKDWSEVVATNYVANAVLCHHVPINSGGRIIAISSVHGATGVYGASAYASTKSALEGLVRSLALDFAKNRVSVNAVRIGFVDAGMFLELPVKYQELYKSRIPMGHVGSPEHLASFIYHLCTAPECGYITGQIISYDGGYMSNWWGQ